MLTRTSDRRDASAWPALVRSFALPLALSLVCLRSLVDGGYVVQLDTVFGPRTPPVQAGFGLPVSALQAAAVELLGGELAGRLYAVATLAFAGFAPMVLFRRAPWYAQGAAGVIGMLNPWTYARVVDGQWGIATAASVLFLWLAAWERLQAKPGWGSALLVALCGAVAAAFDPHVIGPIVVLAIGGAIGQRVWRNRERVRWLALAGILNALLLSYAVVSFFVSDDRGGYSTVRQFTRADFAFFRSVSSEDYGLVVNLVGLYGYWGERLGRFPLANADAPWWPLTTAVLVAAALAGAWLYRDRAWLLVTGVVGLALSASTALPGGVDAAARLASWVPLVGAYREPQKWSALWLLALVVLAASAVVALARRSPRLAPALAYALVVCALFPAGLGQIRSTAHVVEPIEYPDYWYATAAFLEREASSRDVVLVLPWHLYQPLAASGGRVVANPATVFFPGRLVVAQNLEIPGRFGEVGSRYDAIGELIRREGHGSCAVADSIRRNGVTWVIVLDGLENREALVGLRGCGFRLVQGQPGRTAVLRVV